MIRAAFQPVGEKRGGQRLFPVLPDIPRRLVGQINLLPADLQRREGVGKLTQQLQKHQIQKCLIIAAYVLPPDKPPEQLLKRLRLRQTYQLRKGHNIAAHAESLFLYGKMEPVKSKVLVKIPGSPMMASRKQDERLPFFHIVLHVLLEYPQSPRIDVYNLKCIHGTLHMASPSLCHQIAGI